MLRTTAAKGGQHLCGYQSCSGGVGGRSPLVRCSILGLSCGDAELHGVTTPPRLWLPLTGPCGEEQDPPCAWQGAGAPIPSTLRRLWEESGATNAWLCELSWCKTALCKWPISNTIMANSLKISLFPTHLSSCVSGHCPERSHHLERLNLVLPSTPQAWTPALGFPCFFMLFRTWHIVGTQ